MEENFTLCNSILWIARNEVILIHSISTMAEIDKETKQANVNIGGESYAEMQRSFMKLYRFVL